MRKRLCEYNPFPPWINHFSSPISLSMTFVLAGCQPVLGLNVVVEQSWNCKSEPTSDFKLRISIHQLRSVFKLFNSSIRLDIWHFEQPSHQHTQEILSPFEQTDWNDTFSDDGQRRWRCGWKHVSILSFRKREIGRIKLQMSKWMSPYEPTVLINVSVETRLEKPQLASTL